MDSLISISSLNDFIFCPLSIYFHKLYGNMSDLLLKGEYQISGTAVHNSIDEDTYSTRKDVICNKEIYCEKYGLIGKIDIFDGKNKKGVSHVLELYENNVVSDIDTAARLYGYTEETAIYQDATFFVNGNKNIDDVMKKLQRLDINWKSYNLIKSSSNYPGLQQSISGIYGIADKLLMGSLIFSGLVLTLLLFLWINARRKEIGIMLSLGKTKVDIIGQFILELIIISVLAFTGAYFVANYTAKGVSDNILTNINSEITKKSEKEGKSSNVGGGAEVDGFNRTLTKLNVKINVQDVIYVGILCTIIILIALGVASYKIMKKHPKTLLTDIE